MGIGAGTVGSGALSLFFRMQAIPPRPVIDAVWRDADPGSVE
jgi:hypothetical protein